MQENWQTRQLNNHDHICFIIQKELYQQDGINAYFTEQQNTNCIILQISKAFHASNNDHLSNNQQKSNTSLSYMEPTTQLSSEENKYVTKNVFVPHKFHKKGKVSTYAKS